MVADYESDIRFSKFKMADPIWRTQFKNCLDLSEIHYSGVLGIADYESGIRFSKINMADQIWRQQNEDIKYIRLKHIASLSDLLDTHYAGFWGLLIMNLV